MTGNTHGVLVTGGAGFIGSHLVDALIEGGHRVRILDSLDPQVHGDGGELPSYVNDGAEYVRGDVRDEVAVARAVEGMDVVFHQAAAVGVGQSMYRVRHYMDVNTVGTAVLMEAVIARRATITKVVVASSMSIYGEGSYRNAAGDMVVATPRPVSQFQKGQWELRAAGSDEALVPCPTSEEKPLRPSSPYAVGKRDQEELCLTLGRAYGVPTVALRYFNVYGERQSPSNPYTGIAAIFASRVLNGRPPLLFEDGLQSRDFVHVSDIVRANLLALDCDAMDYDSFNVGTGRPLTVLDIANAVVRILRSTPEAEEALRPRIVEQFREGDIRHCFGDITKIQTIAGFEPLVAFEGGIRRSLEWFRGQKAIDRVAEATEELRSMGLTK